MKKRVIIYGRHAVEGALFSKAREIYEILAVSGIKFNIPAEFLPITRLSTDYEIAKILASKEKEAVHQGILAFCSPLRPKTLKDANLRKDKSLVVVLDSLTDITNIGSIIRSSCAFEADFVLYHKANMPDITSNDIIIKNSCGGIENVQIITESNLVNSLLILKKNGYWIVGMDGKGSQNLHDFTQKNFSIKKVALILGNEGKGMRELTRQVCDFLIKIEISPRMESLNVSSAAAIALYELSKIL